MPAWPQRRSLGDRAARGRFTEGRDSTLSREDDGAGVGFLAGAGAGRGWYRPAMPYDPAYDDEEKKGASDGDSTRIFKDFDCPDCSANNPYDDGFGDGDEVRCYYCGQDYLAQVNDSGRLKLKAL